MMARRLFVMGLVITVTLLISSFGNRNVYQCKRQETMLSVGQFANHWKQPFLVDQASGIEFGLTNDDLFLYVVLKTDRWPLIESITNRGVQLVISGKRKSKTSFMLKFPVSSGIESGLLQKRNPGSYLTEPGQPGTPRVNNAYFNNYFLTGLSLMLVSGAISNPELRAVYNRPMAGPEAILRLDNSGMLYYEAKIPLPDIFSSPAEYLSDEKSFFSFAISLETLQKNENNPDSFARKKNQPDPAGMGRPKQNHNNGFRFEKEEMRKKTNIQKLVIEVKKARLAMINNNQ